MRPGVAVLAALGALALLYAWHEHQAKPPAVPAPASAPSNVADLTATQQQQLKVLGAVPGLV